MVASWKINYVKELSGKIAESKILAISNVMDIPSSALQVIRRNLKEKGFDLKVVRKRLLIKALEDIAKKDQNYKKIIDILRNNKRITIMLILPKEPINPFVLNKILEENKTYREARPGDVLERDIVVKAGPTNFSPGPILSEFKKFKIKTKIEGGKIAVVEDTVIARKGERVNEELAAFIKKLDIKPIPVKVKLLLVYDGKILYTEDILSTPLEKYIEDLRNAFLKAYAVTVYIGYPTKDNIRTLLKRSFENALKLSIKIGLPNKYSVKEMIRRAIRVASHIKNKFNI